MKTNFSPMSKLLLLSLVGAPALSFLSLVIVGVFAHSSDIMKLIGMCLAPGTFLYLWWPAILDSQYFLPLVVGIEFVIFVTVGALYITLNPRHSFKRGA